MGITLKSYEDFCAAIRQRESNGVYTNMNRLGYMGAYQFGMARLCDLGLTKRIDPKSTSLANKDFYFLEPLTQEKFLKNNLLQDICFSKHVQMLEAQINKCFGNDLSKFRVQDKGIDMSGCIAVCHLLCLGGLLVLVNHGKDDADAFGTKASEYLFKFAGYLIP